MTNLLLGTGLVLAVLIYLCIAKDPLGRRCNACGKVLWLPGIAKIGWMGFMGGEAHGEWRFHKRCYSTYREFFEIQERNR